MTPTAPRDQPPTAPADALARALGRLTSFSEGDVGVLDVVRCGIRAVAPLRALLFRRETSGLFQTRCRVVEALAALRAHDVLVEFLDRDEAIQDPVERAGEDAVINAAARAVQPVADEPVVQRLRLLAETRQLAGPIEVLGRLRRLEVLPGAIVALADGVARPAAEAALRMLGPAARVAVLAAVNERSLQYGGETDMSLRRRRAALALLLELGPPGALPGQQMETWMGDDDPSIAILGCRMALRSDDVPARRKAVKTLLRLFLNVAWPLRSEIEDCIIECAVDPRRVVDAGIPATPSHDVQRC
jgi:hypothetical protein